MTKFITAGSDDEEDDLSMFFPGLKTQADDAEGSIGADDLAPFEAAVAEEPKKSKSKKKKKKLKKSKHVYLELVEELSEAQARLQGGDQVDGATVVAAEGESKIDEVKQQEEAKIHGTTKVVKEKDLKNSASESVAVSDNAPPK